MKKFFNYLNERTRKLNFIDMKLVQLGTFFITILIIILFPVILKINIYLLILLIILSIIIPVYKWFFKK